MNKMFKEPENMNDDPFFQPKDMEKREEEESKKREQLASKIESGLQNIKIAYENKKYESKEEEIFLKMFSNFHLSKKYNKQYHGYSLLDLDDAIMCFFDLKNDVFWISYYNIWEIFEKEFHLGGIESKQFMKQILHKHFNVYGFTSVTWTGGSLEKYK